MKMSEEMAVRLHQMMWSDMQRELGDCPDGNDRIDFKHEWVKRNFPGEGIANDCWLCEYASSVAKPSDPNPYCKYCPISWPDCHCNTMNFSYTSEPISAILALPAKNDKIMDEKAVAYSYYKYREDLLSKASGIPASLAIEDHVKAIQEKAVQQSNLSKIYGDTKMELAKASGHPAADAVTDHIKAIQEKASETFKTTSIMLADKVNDYKDKLSRQSGIGLDRPVDEHISAIKEKAVEEYFEKTPGAKLATMDVDQAFKQYADEQKAPISRQLAAASGLSAGNESVKAHISEISSKAKSKGRAEMATEIFESLSAYSGVSKDNWSVGAHVKVIQEKAKEPTEPLKTVNVMLADKVNGYKDALSKESNLDRNRPVDDHIREIVKNSMEAGAAEERDRIQEKIYEVLLS